MIVEIEVPLLVLGQLSDQTERQLDPHQLPLVRVVDEDAKLPRRALLAGHRVGGAPGLFEVTVRVGHVGDVDQAPHGGEGEGGGYRKSLKHWTFSPESGGS